MTNRAAIPNPALEPLAALIGDWHTTGKHPAVPEKTLHGKASFEWIEGGAFLVMHSQLDDDRFPDGIAIVGKRRRAPRIFHALLRSAGRLQEIRFRVRRPNMELVATGEGLSQRFTCTITDGGRTMVGRGRCPRRAGPGKRTWISPIGESLNARTTHRTTIRPSNRPRRCCGSSVDRTLLLPSRRKGEPHAQR